MKMIFPSESKISNCAVAERSVMLEETDTTFSFHSLALVRRKFWK